MCDDEAGLVLHQLDECTLDTVLGADINRAGSLVENEHRRVHEHYTRDADELLLSLQVYSEGDWAALYYDTKNQALLHCDHPLLRKEGQDYSRFLMLDEYDTIMTVNTDRITRSRPAPQRA